MSRVKIRVLEDDSGSSSGLSSAPEDVLEQTSRKRQAQGEATSSSRKRTKGVTREKVKGEDELEIDEAANKQSSRKKGGKITKSVKVGINVKSGEGREDQEDKQASIAETTPSKGKRSSPAKNKRPIKDDVSDFSGEDDNQREPKAKRVLKKEEGPSQGGTKEAIVEGLEADGVDVKAKRRRKTKEEKEAEAMPLAARTLGSKVTIGAHVSGAGGVHNAVANCVHIGGNAFALFLKSQRKWENPPLQQDHISQFQAHCAQHSYSANAHVLPHGSYLVNLAAAEPAKATQAYTSFLDDIRRCAALGIRYYNIHPGNTNGEPRADAIGRIAAALNRANAETEGTGVTTLLENMAASPITSNTIGGAFEDLRDIVALVEDKSRVGVTLDTCHAFAAGYDLRTPEAYADVMSRFESIVGAQYLKAVHLNDSKAPLSSHRDLHQQIGLGFLGLRSFHNLVNDVRFKGLPLVLETPIDRKDVETGKSVEDKGVWAREIKLLESLVGMDAGGEKFKALEKRLADEGAEERKKYQESFEKKLDKGKKKANKGENDKSKSARKKKAKEVRDEESSLNSAEEST